ncbi:pyruvate dehydrogenase (acetyl-transferring) E1 component subunit alpha [Halomonas kalidii]|uniref:Pyruvate dehydrogenase E1 component subunit alpha n=1 Tax=Halomonas kalidii TaxID=3043293 RepID=A0ABT6VR81_9GAMM|nr:pyruvate dehydrogenase (acetyl-transferring) E1 component subunit alpha [Halomonas kalidii]MDI5936494.1 pyruvate dehydrogenase (acetyl-transferring) E1 component subunit alpha [Halomonas kalidii]
MTKPSTDKPRLSRAHLLDLLRQMVRIRRFEERCVELYTQEKIRGFLHVYIGEEAVGTGVMHGLKPDDAVVSTYREHGHALLNRIPMDRVMAEMYGKQTGCSMGRGGSMHLFDAAARFVGGNAIVGGGLPLAVGLALADKLAGRSRATVCFFGDGAAAEGAFHESLNLAALWKLPVLFVCENNLYAMGTALRYSHAQTELHRKAEALGVLAEWVDGMDIARVEAASARLLEALHAGEGPRFLECRTYRFRAHSMFDPELYRDKAEVEEWKSRDPIQRLSQWMQQSGMLHEGELEVLEGEIAAEIERAVAYAEAAEWEPEASRFEHVYREASDLPTAPPTAETDPLDMSYREAFRLGLIEALEHDERVFLMGEDIGHYGGCYAVSRGLLERFGPERIRDTPLSENGFTGAGVGAALGGARPIVEIMTVNFSLLAMDQIVNAAATLLHMSGGEFNVPLVIRMATGAGRQVAAQHSHSLENWYAHVPGLKVLAPGTLEDARYMLWAALQDPNPVLIFEHVMLYNREGRLDPRPQGVDIERAAIRRPGHDLSLITYGGSLPKTLEAAEALTEEGIEAEVVDLRVLRPLDTSTLLESVGRTHRAVIVDEGWKTGSLAGEIAAILAEQAFWALDAPIERVCTDEIPIPYPRHLENAALPQVADILAAALRTMGAAP